MPTTQPLPPKKEVALALLERSNDRGIYVHLDPRRAGVTVPPWFKKQPQLVLQIGLNMAIPIPDLRLDDDGMRCTLSFSGSPFYCVVPWSVVFAIVGDDARGMVWPDDVPVEVSRQAAPPRAVESPARKEREGWKAEPASEGKAEGAGKPKKPRKRPALAAVADEEIPSAPPSAPSSKPAKPVRTPQPVQAAAPSSPVIPPAAPSRPAVGAPRKKRELPPYLRVVK
jgi:stringent starvation protein B